MFESIKAYIHLRKMNKFLKGVKAIAELTDDVSLLKEAEEALIRSSKISKMLWRNKVAKTYNQERLKKGL